MYHVELINIKEDDPFFAFCDDITNKAKNMFNVANFYIRNIMTGIKKDKASLTANEVEVLNVVSESIESLNAKYAGKGTSKQFTCPTADKWFLGYNTLDGIFKTSGNALIIKRLLGASFLYLLKLVLFYTIVKRCGLLF